MISTATAEHMDPLDWFPIHAARTLSDQDLLGLTLQEFGAFWKLQLFCWKDGSVPASPKKLAILCRATEKQMEKVLRGLEHLLEPHPESPDRLIMPLPLAERARPCKRETIPAKQKSRVIKFETRHTEPEENGSVLASVVQLAAVPEKTKEVEVPCGHDEGTTQSIRTGETPEGSMTLGNSVPHSAPQEDSIPQEATTKDSAPENKPPDVIPHKIFYRQQEDVFDAHELGLKAFGLARKDPERFKHDWHYRSIPNTRRRAVAKAIKAVGYDVARQAARNVVLATHLFDSEDLHLLDIENACRDPERIAQLFQGTDDELIEAVRKHWEPPDPERERLLGATQSPWDPAPWQGQGPSEDKPRTPHLF